MASRSKKMTLVDGGNPELVLITRSDRQEETIGDKLFGDRLVLWPVQIYSDNQNLEIAARGPWRASAPYEAPMLHEWNVKCQELFTPLLYHFLHVLKEMIAIFSFLFLFLDGEIFLYWHYLLCYTNVDHMPLGHLA